MTLSSRRMQLQVSLFHHQNRLEHGKKICTENNKSRKNKCSTHYRKRRRKQKAMYVKARKEKQSNAT
uniref:Uncharacterized protein n=1 Tax=Anguilla anguilla TaxID=7936 RepID=A0A0E9RRX8_ANGAN